MNIERCNYIKTNNSKCKKLVEPNQSFCWIHKDLELCNSLDSSKLVQNLTDVKLDIEPHIKKIDKIINFNNLDDTQFFIDLINKYDLDPEYMDLIYYYEFINITYNTVNDEIDGKMIIHNIKENIIFAKYKFKNDKLHGIQYEYNFYDQSLAKIYNYKNGLQHGIQYIYYNNIINSKYNMKNGKLEGEYIKYIDNIQNEIQFIQIYKNDILIDTIES